jgi:hypothetical protein
MKNIFKSFYQIGKKSVFFFQGSIAKAVHPHQKKSTTMTSELLGILTSKL